MDLHTEKSIMKAKEVCRAASSCCQYRTRVASLGGVRARELSTRPMLQDRKDSALKLNKAKELMEAAHNESLLSKQVFRSLSLGRMS